MGSIAHTHTHTNQLTKDLILQAFRLFFEILIQSQALNKRINTKVMHPIYKCLP